MPLDGISSDTISGLSIHLLSARTPSQLKDRKATEGYIAKIVGNYNMPKAKEEQVGQRYEQLSLRNWNTQEHKGFCAKLYYSRREKLSDFAAWAADVSGSSVDTFKGAIVHFVLFLYREFKRENTLKKTEQQWEVFALTTHDGWRVVKPYADFRFPVRIAARLISPSFTSSDSKSLAGNKDSSSDTYREEYSLRRHEIDTIWNVFKGFSSHFKLGSSLYNPSYKITSFCNGAKKPVKRAVEVGIGKLTVAGKHAFEQHEQILDHFSRIIRGDEIYRLEGDERVIEEDDPAWRYLENIQPVEGEVVPKLNNALIRLVWEYYRNATLDGQLSFNHRYYKDFYKSQEFHLKYKNYEIRFYHRPSLSEVFDALRPFLEPCATFEEFCSKLNCAKFNYSRKNELFPLREFFQGELLYEGKMFFHIDGMWLKVTAGHLSVLQRTFYQLLKDHLISRGSVGDLPLPWFAKVDWVAFSLQDAMDALKVDQKSLEEILKRLEETKFSFIDSEGNVLCPYPTRCILEGRTEGGSKFIKAIKKNWESLKLILESKAKAGKALTARDLQPIFTNKDLREKFAKELMKILAEERPVVSKGVGKVESVAVLRDDGVPLFTNLDEFQFKCFLLRPETKAVVTGKATKIQDIFSRQVIGALLVELKESGQPCDEAAIRKRLTPHKFSGMKDASISAVIRELQAPQKTSTAVLRGSRYLVQGPIPDAFEADPAILKYLNEHHQNYQCVLEEEGYNRLYLQRRGFLVCDQVYAGNQEKVELWDVLHFEPDPNREIHLYHIKETFGQPTRAACAQIRVAAALIGEAINSGRYEVLRKLYTQVMSTAADTPFRKQLKECFEALALPKDSTEQSDALVSLFQRERKKICFVYAFIDSADKKERLLENEMNPEEIQEQDLTAVLNDAEKSRLIFRALRKNKFLDEHGRMTDCLLRASKDAFIEVMQEVGEAEKVYRFLQGRISQFDSLVAKIELLHLRDFIEGLGFSFKICQIRRSMKTSISTSKTGSFHFDKKAWRGVSASVETSFRYNQQYYNPQGNRCGMQEVLATLLELSPQADQKTFVLKLRNELVKTKSKKRDDWEEFFRSLAKKVSDELERYPAVVQTAFEEEIPTPLEDEDFARLFNAYLSGITVPNFPFDLEDLEFFSKRFDAKVIFFSKDRFGLVQTNKPEVHNPHGKNEHVFIKIQNFYESTTVQKLTAEEDAEDDLAVAPRLHYSEVLPPEEQEILLSQDCSIGLINTGNDCFFNAAMQLIIHSAVYRDLLNPDKLERIENGPTFFSFFREFALGYSLAAQQKTSSQARVYSHEEMRTILNFSEEDQEDTAEVISRAFACYKLNESTVLSKFRRRFSIGSSDAKKVSGADPNEYSKIDKDGHAFGPIESGMLVIDAPRKKCTFQKLVDELFQEKVIEDSYRYTHGKRVYEVQDYREVLRVQKMNRGVFFQVRRFNNNGDKNSTPLGFRSTEVKIQEHPHELKGFIVHTGESAKGGHYFTYCKTAAGWVRYDDGSISECAEPDVLKAASDAYVLYFEKK